MMIHSWPSAILHLDADAFFASVEQAIHPRLKGKPVITGAERGIVAAASYEAKRAGVKRGVPLGEAKKICPGLICLPSDYETYSIFSKRMFAIMRRFSPMVEEYSIDEAFADLSGLRRLHRTSFEGIGRMMKETVERELGITVSVGVSLSKSLAKLASKKNKPSGLVAVPGREIEALLAVTDLPTVWGFGPATVALLRKLGVKSALDFVREPEEFAKKYFGKIGIELHRELSGVPVYPVVTCEKSSYVTISKFKTFTPPSKDREFVYAQALRNLESGCMKARRYDLLARKLCLILRRQDFRHEALEVKLSRPTVATLELQKYLSLLFDEIWRPGVPYRATGIVLGDLSVAREVQFGLFEAPLEVIRKENVSRAMDEINEKFGKHKVHLAESLPAQRRHEGVRGELPARKKDLLTGENFRQRLIIPLLQ
ncbi:MAG: DNA polymerase IV [Deltaproteobacteria bacterium]|nr:DNA polymerase IV [Deltaproteobacteria bacterium]